MDKYHNQRVHANEGKSKECLHCVITNQNEIITTQQNLIEQLEYSIKLKDEKMEIITSQLVALKLLVKAITSRYICFYALCSLLSSLH